MRPRFLTGAKALETRDFDAALKGPSSTVGEMPSERSPALLKEGSLVEAFSVTPSRRSSPVC